MKKLLLLIAVLTASFASAQNYNFNIGSLQYASGPSVPGSCSRAGSYFFKNSTTKGWYICNGSTYDAIAIGSSGGTVTNVLGTANQIVSDGSTTMPTLSLSPTLVIPGTITSASYTTSSSNGGIKGIEGTGAGLTAAAGTDLFFPDSSSHCWHGNLNNTDVGCAAFASNTLTMSNKTFVAPVLGVATGTSLTLGTNPATTGTFNFQNATTFYGRNAANTADIRLWNWDSGNTLTIGGIGAAGTVSPVSMNLQVGSAGPNLALDGTNNRIAINGSTTTLNWAGLTISQLATGVLAIGTTTASVGARTGMVLAANSIRVATSDFTTAANTSLQTITGLSWTLPATAMNLNFHCRGSYSQATGAAAVAFGIQAATNSPTNIFAQGTVQITAGPPATFVTGTLATLATTTATSIVSGTPGAQATNYTFDLAGTIENPASANTINVMVSTATSGDAVTVLRGSYCSINP